MLTPGEGGRHCESEGQAQSGWFGAQTASLRALLTIPGDLGASAVARVKLPDWLVATAIGFLLPWPMASIDWLLLRITRYRERRKHTLSRHSNRRVGGARVEGRCQGRRSYPRIKTQNY